MNSFNDPIDDILYQNMHILLGLLFMLLLILFILFLFVLLTFYLFDMLIGLSGCSISLFLAILIILGRLGLPLLLESSIPTYQLIPILALLAAPTLSPLLSSLSAASDLRINLSARSEYLCQLISLTTLPC